MKLFHIKNTDKILYFYTWKISHHLFLYDFFLKSYRSYKNTNALLFTHCFSPNFRSGLGYFVFLVSACTTIYVSWGYMWVNLIVLNHAEWFWITILMYFSKHLSRFSITVAGQAKHQTDKPASSLGKVLKNLFMCMFKNYIFLN